jgi:anti-sigma regulatory factor (Ser/Thr protein kinase)
MPANQKASTNGHAPFPEQLGRTRSELDDLRATCRRQAHVIDALTEAVVTLRRGAKALKAENTELKAENTELRTQHDRASRRRRPGAQVNGRAGGERIEIRFALDVHAPAAARSAVTDFLGDRVAPSVLDTAQLLVSELVTNSVLPAGAEIIVRVEMPPDSVRLNVEDAGRGGAIAPRPPDPEGGGFGLNLVQALSERWGIERAAQGGTCVWAQLARAPLTAVAS